EIVGGAGDNLFDASAFSGQALLFGGAGNDILIGTANNDVIDGGAGDDSLVGGLGSDDYVFDGSNLGSDTVVEAANVDADTLDFSAFLGAVKIDLALGGTQVVSPGNLSLTLVDPSNAHPAEQAGIENVIGSPFDDQILGNSRPNSVLGGPGL